MSTTIRRAVSSDIPAIIGMAQDMHAESPRYRTLGFSAEKVSTLALALIRNGMPGGVLVAEREGWLVGMFAFHVGQHFFGDDTFASDIVMYVSPEHRSGSIFPRMVLAFEAWADEYKVKEKLLGVSAEIDSERVVAVLLRLGYANVATGTMKRT